MYVGRRTCDVGCRRPARDVTPNGLAFCVKHESVWVAAYLDWLCRHPYAQPRPVPATIDPART